MTTDRPRYAGVDADSARWDDFAFRNGDIVIVTPSKCGTTLTQLLCALLVFDGPDFPGPLSRISPWLDMRTQPLPDVLALLDAQPHRRFIKTHTPLDGLPLDPRATYLCVARDPRDAHISHGHHRANMDRARFDQLIADATKDEEPLAGPDPDAAPDDHGTGAAPDSPANPSAAAEGLAEHQDMRRWIDDLPPVEGTDDTLPMVLHHFDQAWAHRHDPNVFLFHFQDLVTDLPAELARLAGILGYAYPPERIEELAAEADIERVRARADQVAPNAHQLLWKDPTRFFRAGQVGEWRQVLDDDDLRAYEANVARLVGPDVAAWAHHGRHGTDISP